MKSAWILVATLLILFCSSVFAASAAWYKWQNTYDKSILCKQLPPGDTWEIIQGPFQDSECRKPGNPH